MTEGREVQELVVLDDDLDDIGAELHCAGREATFGFLALSPNEGAAWSGLHIPGQGVTRSFRVNAPVAARG